MSWRPRTTRALLLVTAVVTALRAAWAVAVPLAPQEAYYWQYARHLALGYFDHPPLAAWLIAGSVRVLGSSELGVRAPALIAGALLTVLLYRLGARVASPRAGVLAALAANGSILFGLGAVVITPDVPLVLCWTAALVVLCEVVLPDGRGAGPFGARWYALGALCGLALLSKYTAALLPVQILVTCLSTRRGRRELRTWHPYLAVGVALAVFSPVIVWNLHNDWASFAFQTSSRLHQVSGARASLLGGYVGLQAIAVGPLLYVSIWIALFAAGRLAWRGDERARLLFLTSAPALALFTVVSPWHWVKMNWVGPTYVGLLVALASLWSAGWDRPPVRRWAEATIAVGAVTTLVAHALPLVPSLPFPARDDMWSGWKELASEVHRLRTERGGEAPLVAGWGYKTASELAFYLPGQPRTLSSDALGAPALAYDYWDVRPRTRDLLVVADERSGPHEARASLGASCERADVVARVQVHRDDRLVTRFYVWRCEGWTGGRVEQAENEARPPRTR